MDFCVIALGRAPKKSGKTGHGQLNATLQFGHVTFRTGDYLYADEDGIFIADKAVYPGG
ncbi:regulator of RNase E activity RraA [Pseudorhizobium tarimense]|uniref:Regulator of RNase E activity RraA n=1 Tax=Pseudorhizobium tarimense TaxID=1079109 RepID=A0ABV2HD49_9HYPH|nr:hypothetical protein [Pseudorhizobium tarimense]MCJ8521550.1 hypothetical protein [Pseudorhizobium tarimense]